MKLRSSELISTQKKTICHVFNNWALMQVQFNIKLSKLQKNTKLQKIYITINQDMILHLTMHIL